MIQKYRKAINPPYSRKDFPIILLTLFFLLLIPVTLIFLNQRNIYQGQAANDRMRIQPNNPRLGLNYDGLIEDMDGKCNGLFRIKADDNPALDKIPCTHGPDPAPEGVDATISVPPITENETPVLGTTITCDGDGTSGKRTQV